MYSSAHISATVNPRDILVRLGVVVVFLNLIAVAIAWWTITDRQTSIYQREKTNVSNLAQILSHDVTSILDKSDLAIQAVIDELKDHGIEKAAARASIGATIAKELGRHPEVGALRLVDVRGIVILGAGSSQITNGMSVADREYFTRLQANPDAGLVISEPLVGRLGGKPGIVLARAFKNSAGEFAGIVYAFISTASFERFFSTVEVEAQDVIALRTDKLTLVARYKKGDSAQLPPGSNLVSNEFRNSVSSSPQTGTFVAKSVIDDTERTFAYRKVPAYPFYVLVAFMTSQPLAEWRLSAMAAVSVLAVYIIATIALSWLLLHSWRRREAAIAALAQRESEFSKLTALAPGLISQFQIFPDGRMCVPFISDAVQQIYELKPEEIRHDAAPLVARVHPDDMASAVAALRHSFRTLERIRFEHRIILPGGRERWIRTESQPERRPDRSVVWHGYASDITEQKRSEQALRASKARFRSLMELGSQWYWEQDKHFRFVQISDGILHTAGLQPDDYLGKTRWEMASEGISEETWLRHRAQLERHETYRQFEMTLRDRDGRLRVITSSGEPIFDEQGQFSGYRGVGTDITERRLAEDSLREREERLRAIFDAANAGISIVDRSGKYLMFNDQWTAYLGYDRAEMQNLNYQDVTHPDDLDEANARFLEVIDGKVEKYRFEKRYVRKDGAVIWADLSVSALKDKVNEVVHVLGTLVDITERKHLQESLQRINAELEYIVDERTRNLVEANAELQTITYTLAHDLRAPARHVTAFAAQLSESYGAILPENGRRWLSLMATSAQRQAQLIEEMLSYIKLGLQVVAREPVNINEIVGEVSRELLAQRASDVKIEWLIAKLPVAEGDHTLVRVILTNLLSNAAKFSARQTHPVIEIGCINVPGKQPVYFVRDNGAGFDPAKAAKLFGLFQRMHDSADYPGIGMGLAIVKRLVEKHGGRIWAEAAPGSGATFYFTLHEESTKNECESA